MKFDIPKIKKILIPELLHFIVVTCKTDNIERLPDEIKATGTIHTIDALFVRF